MERLLMVSSDGHAVCSPEVIRPYLEPEYHSWLVQLEQENELHRAFTAVCNDFSPEVLDLIDEHGALRAGAAYEGSADVSRRLAEMDREGIAAEMLIKGTQLAIPPFFAVNNGVYPADVRAAGTRAYHRWVADSIAESDGRLFATADPGPALDMDELLRELRWVAEHGFRSISVPGIVVDPALPPLYSDYYEPFWRACAELDMTLSVHAGHGRPQGEFLEFMRQVTDGKSQEEALGTLVSGAKGSPFALDLVPSRVMWSLMLGGVFDRYPSLKLVFTEVRADWVPATLAALDERFERGDTPLQKRPSEYWHSNCWAAVSSIKRSEVRLRHEIGVDRMMFGRDFPHPEGTWPNTWDWLRDALGHVEETELRQIVGLNAIECYGLDAAHLKKVAERIGPRPEDILGGHEVDPRLVEHFHTRGGYDRSAENIDVDEVLELFEEDIVGAASS